MRMAWVARKILLLVIRKLSCKVEWLKEALAWPRRNGITVNNQLVNLKPLSSKSTGSQTTVRRSWCQFLECHLCNSYFVAILKNQFFIMIAFLHIWACFACSVQSWSSVSRRAFLNPSSSSKAQSSNSPRVQIVRSRVGRGFIYFPYPSWSDSMKGRTD